MNKVCKEYISDAKKFFPIMGKKEREYLRKVRFDIEDFVETENITTKSELVEKYHQPYEVANNYYATFFDTELIIKRIKISKYIKIFISILTAVILLSASLFIIFYSENHNTAKREEMISNDTSFVDGEKYSEHETIKSDNFIDDEEEIIEENIID